MNNHLEALESMARQNCHTEKAERDYNGQVAGTLVTDSGAISAHADALETLAEHGRFRIVAAMGRMVVGYWPENDPTSSETLDGLTVKAEDYNRLHEAACGLLLACKNRLPPGHYDKVSEECRALDRLL